MTRAQNVEACSFKMAIRQCCQHCFADNELRSFIKAEGQLGECDFCGRRNAYCVDAPALRPLFEPIVAMYKPREEMMSTGQMKESEGRFIWEVLDEDGRIFEDGVDYSRKKDLFEAIFAQGEWCDKDDAFQMYSSASVERPGDYYETDSRITEQMATQWAEFRREIIEENRFFLQKVPDRDRIADLFSFFGHEIKPSDAPLYRARLGPPEGKYPKSKMGKPPVDKATDGRANPRGISYLYLASTPELAVAEIRPHIGSNVTIGRFKIINSICVVDLRNPRIDSPFRFGKSLDYVLRHLGFLRLLGKELSEPIDPDKAHLDYLPTQYLCELIKYSGYEGVLYSSAFGNGHNVALFSDTKVKPTSTTSRRVSSICIQIQAPRHIEEGDET